MTADDLGGLAAAKEIRRGKPRRLAGAELGQTRGDRLGLAAAEIGEAGVVPAADPAFDMMDRLRMGDDLEGFHAGPPGSGNPAGGGSVQPSLS